MLLQKRGGWVDVKVRVSRIAPYSALLAAGLIAGLMLSPAIPADWTAVAQTFLGLVAVAVAIYVPWAQRRAQIEDGKKKEAALRKTMRVALRQPVGTFARRCEALERKIVDGTWRTETPPKTLFKRPPEFNQFRSKLHLLGPLGEDVNELIGAQEEAATIVKSIRATGQNLAPSALLSYCEKLQRYTQAADRCVERLKLEADY